jgi:hypothetical protein
MKSGVARTISLSTAAVNLLDSVKPDQITPDTLIFGSRRRGGSGRQTNDAMQNLLRVEMGHRYTVHGFRSSFMDWVAEVLPQRLLEAERALDHKIGNQVQRAYLRTDFLDQRRELAELWGAHLMGESILLKASALVSEQIRHPSCYVSRRTSWKGGVTVSLSLLQSGCLQPAPALSLRANRLRPPMA